MSGNRWSEEDLANYERRLHSVGTLDPQRVPEARGERAPARGPKKARGNPTTASKLETELYGHLTVMQLKPELQHKFHPERRWRLDFAFPDVMVGVEVDGGVFAAENGGTAGRHARGAGIVEGFEKKNAAAELGWFVLCYGPPQVRSGEAALQIERIVTARRGGLLLRECDGTVNETLKQKHAR